MESDPDNSIAVQHTGDISPSPPYWNTTTTILLAVTIVLIMLLGLVGNTMVIIVVARHKGMRTRTNMFLCNLAVADLLCTIAVMPFSLGTVLNGEWIFGDIFCQINGFTMVVLFVTSIHTLMYISVHKYISIIHPFSHVLGPVKIKLMIGKTMSSFNLARTILFRIFERFSRHPVRVESRIQVGTLCRSLHSAMQCEDLQFCQKRVQVAERKQCD